MKSAMIFQSLRKENYAKTLVKWMVWEAHYFYWWDDSGKITKMSLQYAD